MFYLRDVMKKIIIGLLLVNLITPAFADKIAIIGGGASGLVSAWLLEKDHEVTLFESTQRLGGHIETITLKVDGQSVLVESGAEFFNEVSYPHFLRLLRYLKIPLKTYTLVTNFYTVDDEHSIILPPYHDGTIETKSLTPGNVLRLLQLKNIVDYGKEIIDSKDMNILLSDFIGTLSLTRDFKNDFFYPFLAAGWGINPEDIQSSSAYIALKYVIEGNSVGGYKWHEAETGLSSYIKAITNALKSTTINLNSPIKSILRKNERYVVTTEKGESGTYDHVIMATNANVAGDILKDILDIQDVVSALHSVQYFDTKIAIHGDRRFMPAETKNWRVINIRYDGAHSAITIYKIWKSKTPIFKSWITYDIRSPKDKGPAMPDNVYALKSYRHPRTNQNYIHAQELVKQVQGYRNIWFAGMWTLDNDSHESALVSAVKIGERLAPYSHRLRAIRGY